MKKIKNEFELRNWFKKNYKSLGFSKILKDNSKGFPDFIMLEKGKKVRIELEIKSSNFILHKHSSKEVDKVICIYKDVKLDIPVIELQDFKKINFNENSRYSLTNQIYNLLKKEKIVTSSEIAKIFNLNWNTADKYLLELVVQSKIQRIKKQGVNLWLLK